MEEPSAPTWDTDAPGILSPWSPPLDDDAPFREEVSRASVSLPLPLLPVPPHPLSVRACVPSSLLYRAVLSPDPSVLSPVPSSCCRLRICGTLFEFASAM